MAKDRKDGNLKQCLLDANRVLWIACADARLSNKNWWNKWAWSHELCLVPTTPPKTNKHLLNHWTSCKFSLRLFQSFYWLDFSWNMVSCFLGSVQEFEWFFLGILTCTWFYRFFSIPTNTQIATTPLRLQLQSCSGDGCDWVDRWSSSFCWSRMEWKDLGWDGIKVLRLLESSYGFEQTQRLGYLCHGWREAMEIRWLFLMMLFVIGWVYAPLCTFSLVEDGRRLGVPQLRKLSFRKQPSAQAALETHATWCNINDGGVNKTNIKFECVGNGGTMGTCWSYYHDPCSLWWPTCFILFQRH